MSIVSNIDKEQIKNLIQQLDDNEKLDISRYLDELIIEKRIKIFVNRKKGIPLSIEEITEEVEKEREKRY